ncbi:MAG: hypothetical protein P1P80_02935 [ANME-2 cluster archaeon]|nr:hypothetical protein [ANME-2 cluster archaeon]
MKDSDGNTISIGDRVKVLWSYDNKIHIGKIIDIEGNLITIHSNGNQNVAPCFRPKITTSDHSKIIKFPEKPSENTEK